MKHFKILVVVMGLLAVSPYENYGQNTFPYVDNLCYTESFVQKIKVSSQITISTLTLQDKLRFTEKSFVKEHHDYVNESNYPVHDITFKQWNKIFPKWYKVADLIRCDESGTRSYFSTNNVHLPGGWSGHTYSYQEHGYYGTGVRQGEERYYHQDHTTQSLAAYNQYKQSIDAFGYVSKFRYFYPTTQMLSAFTQQGFTVIQNANLIQVSNPEIRIKWRLSDKTIVKEFLVNNIAVKTITTKYKIFPLLGQDLKYEEIEITPDVLENGDCIETVMETTFAEYNTNCGNEAAFRSKAKTERNNIVVILPNPADDIITMMLPNAIEIAKISIISLSGQNMFSGSMESTNQIDISQYPSGLYIVNVVQGGHSFTTKFVKQ